IAEGVAWDFLAWTQDWKRLAATADAICFGSLAQRAQTSRSTICQFLTTARKDAVRVFDVNLRQAFFTEEIVATSMKIANIVKLNHEELPKIMELFGLEHQDQIASSKSSLALHDLSLTCVSRGSGGR